jgi:hypothetical protein
MINTDGMSAEKVLSAEGGDEMEALRMWAWFATRHAGGKVTVSYNEFMSLVNQGSATLYWSIDSATLALTIVAESSR